MFDGSPFGQSLVACLVIGYVAFCILYGHASLRARRTAAADFGRSMAVSLPARPDFSGSARFVTKLSCTFLAPVLLLSMMLSFTGRERSGVIEASNLFTVPVRPDATISYLANSATVAKGEIVARFASEGLDHRIAGLRSRRQELVARRDAVKASAVPLSADVLIELQSQEQRLAQLEQKLSELERASFLTRQQSVTEQAAWQRARSDLTARLPTLEQTLSSEIAEFETATRALQRIRVLRDGGYATITQFDRTSVAETLAKNRVNSTRAALDSNRSAIATLDEGYDQTATLLNAQLLKLDAEIATVKKRIEPVARSLELLRPTLAHNETAAGERRRLEVAAADARIEELDAEIAAAIAMAQVKSPVAGRVLYRNTASSTLSGSMPLLVIASSDGFTMRVDLPRDEVPALEYEMTAGSKFQVLVDDASVRRIALANLVRIEDAGIDRKRVTAVFSVDVPEDVLVRMALRGSAPRGILRWSPPIHRIVSSKIAAAFGVQFRPTAMAAGPALPDTAAIPTRASKRAEQSLVLDL